MSSVRKPSSVPFRYGADGLTYILLIQSPVLSLPTDMAEVLIGNRIYRHATKPELAENVPGKVVEAFGLGKCPKLAKQV